jgi:hypothetical protein
LSRPRSGRRRRARRRYGRGRARRVSGGQPADRARGRGGRTAARGQKLCSGRGPGSHRLRTGTSRVHRGRFHRPRGRRSRRARPSGRGWRMGRRGHRRDQGRARGHHSRAHGRARGHSRARGLTARRRRAAQLPDPVYRGRIEAGEIAGLDVNTPTLNTLQKLCTLQTQLLGQLVNSRRQRQLLPDLIPVPRAGRDPGWIFDGSENSLACQPRQGWHHLYYAWPGRKLRAGGANEETNP